MATYDYSFTFDSVEEVDESGTVTEKFDHTLQLANGASDVSLTLGAMTDPIFIFVLGATGVSFKLASGGTDAIGANPFGAVCDDDGLGVTEILLSNSDSVEHTVRVMAGE